MIQSRRNFLFGATASLLAAPAIVRAASLMSVHDIFGEWREYTGWKWIDPRHTEAVMLRYRVQIIGGKAKWESADVRQTEITAPRQSVDLWREADFRAAAERFRATHPVAATA